ncbi:NAD-dependent epimerase/dehydratase family protein [Brevibacillus choshinensis]|uniref:NAD-dependent epimerase/dehydratase family protein n=1 Tax=Brevibacillus choshinensis TaxID=54911 RepID=UPI002E23F133|nr:NAD-dependent epimerase/dehydratase family protein [Brevibacillus choshinensis]MED4780613.1 NAD-dependent epimerase/dehydratase family protein [Brevibacillus choshinensis]
MKKVLVLGGTRFFGKRLVHLLVAAGADVTVATRGMTDVELPPQVKRLTLDRDDPASLAAAGEQEWDIVYDNICYSSQNALEACDVFRGKVGKYVLTSTLSVYDFSEEGLKEEAFDPYTYDILPATRDKFTYQEGKRQAEAVFFQQTDFPVVAVRFPIVLAEDDYTKRLHFHVEHIQEERPIGIANPQAIMCFIHAQEAAEFLQWVGATTLTGPVNACSHGTIRQQTLMEDIADVVGKPAQLVAEKDAADFSPFAFPASFYMDNEKAAAAGFSFWKLEAWLPKLIQTISTTKSEHKV